MQNIVEHTLLTSGEEAIMKSMLAIEVKEILTKHSLDINIKDWKSVNRMKM